jgi:uncharacterized membrane protein YhaH (DUF805 family)
MTDQNPYSAPDATLATDTNATYEPSIFAVSGRIGRLRYLAYGFGVQMLLGLVLLPFGGMAAVASQGEMSMLTMLLAGVFYIASIAFSIIFAKRRFNDLNRSGWWFLLFIIPLVNLLAAIYLIFFPGTQGPNEFGPAPSPNSLGVKILAFIVPVIFIVGMLAAIAIPAYQQYVTQAQQSQIQQ